MATPLQILDTNILVHYVREDLAWTQIRQDYELLLVEPTPLISIVTAGELRSLATQFDWGSAKRGRMEFALGYFKTVPVDSPEQISIYSEIDNYCLERGRVMGKNDLWNRGDRRADRCQTADVRCRFRIARRGFLNLEWVRAPES